MTPQEKAKELFRRFFRITPQPYRIVESGLEEWEGLKFNDWDKDWTNRMAKESALIAVDEIIEAYETDQYKRKTDFWEHVKEEIKKL